MVGINRAEVAAPAGEEQAGTGRAYEGKGRGCDQRRPSEKKPVGLEKERVPDRWSLGEGCRTGEEVMLEGLEKGQWMSTAHGKGADGSANKPSSSEMEIQGFAGPERMKLLEKRGAARSRVRGRSSESEAQPCSAARWLLPNSRRRC